MVHLVDIPTTCSKLSKCNIHGSPKPASSPCYQSYKIGCHDTIFESARNNMNMRWMVARLFNRAAHASSVPSDIVDKLMCLMKSRFHQRPLTQQYSRSRNRIRHCRIDWCVSWNHSFFKDHCSQPYPWSRTWFIHEFIPIKWIKNRWRPTNTSQHTIHIWTVHYLARIHL